VTPQAVERLIDQRFESLSPELQRAARWVRQNPAALALQSMRSTAREAGVAPATMTRLAQRLGFEGFEDLREPFARQLATSMPPTGRLPSQAADPPARHTVPGLASARLQPIDPVRRINALQQDNVAAVLSMNTAESLHAAAETLLQARVVYFMGLRASYGIAWHMHHLYAQVMANAVWLDDQGGLLSDKIARLTGDDALVVVSQSPYARLTVDSVRQALEQQATVITLTDNALAPTARQVPHVLLFATETSSFFRSNTGATALAEALVATVAAFGGARIQRRLQQTQEHLSRSQALWDRPQTPRPDRAAAPATPHRLKQPSRP